jgi:hypothetical protein
MFFLIIACSEDGGQSDDDGGTPIIDKFIEIEGIIEDGASDSPIGDAQCRFVDFNNDELSKATADDNGKFQMYAPEGVEGYIKCNPPSLPKLVLSTYLNTENKSAGDKISNENITPTTTVFCSIVANKLHENLSSAKDNFVNDTAAMGDINIIRNGESITHFDFPFNGDLVNKDACLVAFSATPLFNICYKNDININ